MIEEKLLIRWGEGHCVPAYAAENRKFAASCKDNYVYYVQ